MPTRAAEQLLYDSEATLRLVDNVLEELHQMEAEVCRSEDQMRLLCTQMRSAHTGVAGLPEVLLRAHGEIQDVLNTLQQSRSVLERTAEREGPAAELAPADVLDRLDRALALVDRVDTEDEETGRSEVLADLRTELLEVMARAKGQDFTRQQLGFASSTLVDMEARLKRLARVFEPEAAPEPDVPFRGPAG